MIHFLLIGTVTTLSTGIALLITAPTTIGVIARGRQAGEAWLDGQPWPAWYSPPRALQFILWCLLVLW